MIRYKGNLTDINITELIEILQATLDSHCKTHLSCKRRYFVKFCKDTPYKYELVIYNDSGILFSYTIVELLDALSHSAALCYDMIISKVVKYEKEIQKT